MSVTRWLQRVAVAGLLTLSQPLVASLVAEEWPSEFDTQGFETGTGRLDSGTPLPPVEFSSGPTGRSRNTSSASGIQQIGYSPAEESLTLPVSAVPAVPPEADVEYYSDGDGSTQTVSTDEYQSRVNRIVSGSPVAPQEQSLGDWWTTRTDRWMSHSWQVGRWTIESRPARPVRATRDFLAAHTMPDEVVFDVDVYDQRPLIRGGVQQASAQDAEQAPARGGDSLGRLKTDIRSIQPTLSYALKDIRPEQLPREFHDELDKGEYVARVSPPTVLQWAPTNFYHYPLYFEDPALERYGHTYHPLVQPFASTGRFATQLVGLPYQMALHPACSHEYALGWYRPGDCAPKKHYQIPFNEEATLVQAAVIAGLIIALP
jgi:hypothetical protein